MSKLLKQLEGAARELDTLVEMYVRNDSPTRAADCTAKAASVREAVALLSPSGAPAGLVAEADDSPDAIAGVASDLELFAEAISAGAVQPVGALRLLDWATELRSALSAVRAQPEAVAVPVELAARFAKAHKELTDLRRSPPIVDAGRCNAAIWAFQEAQEALASLFTAALAEKGADDK